MKTQCKEKDNTKTFAFQTENPRLIIAHFNGGNITSDAGGLLLQQTERITGIIKKFAACFTDHRDPDLIEHSVEELVAQRVYALALGYEDLNDHDELRNDVDYVLGLAKNERLEREIAAEIQEAKKNSSFGFLPTVPVVLLCELINYVYGFRLLLIP